MSCPQLWWASSRKERSEELTLTMDSKAATLLSKLPQSSDASAASLARNKATMRVSSMFGDDGLLSEED